MALFGKKKDKDEYESIYDSSKEETSSHNHDHLYDGGSHKKPAACRACGGPYPLCKDGCSIFDDD